MHGRFLTLEGGEGAGKSTQAKWLAEALRAAGVDVLVTREPGGSAGGEAIRKLVVEGDADAWHPTTEALLFMTARYDHVETLIKPALELGTWVICDRFYDSTYMYQGIGKRVGTAWLNQLYAHLFANLAPDYTLLFDIAPEIGLARAAARRGNETRFEGMALSFHQQLRQGFLARAQWEPQRIRVLDASASMDAVHAQVCAAVTARFGIPLKVQAI